MFICHECGRVTDSDDAEFCHYCGSSKGSKAAKTSVPEGFQPMAANGGGVIYADKGKLRRIPLALILAFIPGLFDIFGLGHFVVGKWARGLGFLSISAVFIYVSRYSGWDMIHPYLFLISLAIFVVQMVDLYGCFKKILSESVM